MRRLALLALLLACACVPEGNDGGKVLRVSNWGGAGEEDELAKTVQRLNGEFEKANPGVELRIEGIPGEYVQKMLLNHVAGTMPDVMDLDASSAAVFINNGILRDLRPFIEKDPDFKLSDYYPNVVDIGRRGEAIYAIPGDFTPMVVYYNKRLFDKAGVPYPKPGWTFDDFLQTARRLTVPAPRAADRQYGFVFTNWMPGWIMWLWNGGGDVLSPDGTKATGYLDSPQNVRTVEFLRDLINKHKVAPSLSESASQGVDPFATGQAAMNVVGHWAMPSLKAAGKDAKGEPKVDWTQLGVVEMPRLPGAPRSHTVMYAKGLAIPVGAKNPELAWKYIKMWTGHEFQRAYKRHRHQRAQGRERGAGDGGDRAAVRRDRPSARPPYGSRIEGYEMVEKMGKNALDLVLNNNVPPAEALKQAADRIDKEFAKR